VIGDPAYEAACYQHNMFVAAERAGHGGTEGWNHGFHSGDRTGQTAGLGIFDAMLAACRAIEENTAGVRQLP
jgi:hypothetical protein